MDNISGYTEAIRGVLSLAHFNLEEGEGYLVDKCRNLVDRVGVVPLRMGIFPSHQPGRVGPEQCQCTEEVEYAPADIVPTEVVLLLALDQMVA